jgi:hypothetical protein
MTLDLREPGTYRTQAGALIHLRRAPDGATTLDVEASAHGKLDGDEKLVKLSDDPDWPDLERHAPDPELFAD